MSFTVTATASGAGSANGMALDVRVVTGAALASNQSGATAGNDSSLTTDQLAITPSATGSWVYGSLVNGNGATAFTANGSTTFRANVADATNGVAYCTCRSTGTTTSGTPVTIGASAPTGQPAGTQVIALWEILKLGTLAEDASTPAVVSTTSAKTLTTAAFAPPAGSLLVAIVAGDYSGSGADAVAMTDTSGLGLSWSKKSADPSYGISEIWVAQIPWTVTVTNPGAQTSTQGTAISPLTITGTDSGSLALTWGATGLPTGLSINSSTGVVTGTPSVPGTVSVTVTATDASGGSGSAVFNWTVNSSGAPGSFDLAFATPPLPGAVLDVQTEIYLNGAWVNTSAYTFMDSTGIIRGHPDESTTASPSTLSGTFNNSDGRFSQLNPLSPYYPYLGLNTPMRVSIPDGSTHMRLELDQASGAQCNGSTSFMSSQFEVWVDADADNWDTAQVLAGVWNSGANARSWCLSTTSGGYLQLAVSTAGTALSWTAVSTVQMPYSHGRISVRCLVNASGNTVAFYVGQYCGSWIQLGSSVTTGGGNPFSTSSAKLEVGMTASTDLGLPGLNGKVYAFAVVAGLNNPYSSAVALADFTQVAKGATTFTDFKGNAWSFEGTGYMDNRNYRFHGQVASWPQSWTPGGANATVAFSAAGKLRQMTQGTPPSFSPMRRFFTKAWPSVPGIFAYYPMEDAAGSSQMNPGGIGQFPMTYVGSPALASSAAFLGSLALPVTNGAVFTAKIPSSVSTASAFDLKFLFSEPAAGDANSVNSPYIANIYATGTIAQLQVLYDNGGQVFIQALNSGGGLVWGASSLSSSFILNGQSNAIQVSMVQSGGNIVTTLNVLSQFGVYSTTSISVAGTIGGVTKVILNQGSGTAATTLVNATIGHVVLANQYTPLSVMAAEALPNGAILTPMTGWRNEPAGLRFQRVCLEEGLQFRGMGSMYDTVIMGTQPADNAEDILQSCADTDRGMWYEPRQVFGFGYRTRNSMSNQTPALILDYQQDHLSDTLDPTHDDQTVKNDMTASNTYTGAVLQNVLNDGSPLAANTIGDYSTSIDVNLGNDAALPDMANWSRSALTVNEPRYTGINVDLANTLLQGLWYQVLNVDAGDRVIILNPPAWLPPQKVDQLAQGFCEVLSVKDLREAWNGIPTTPWNVGLFDDPVYCHADTDGCTTTGTLPPLLAIDQTTKTGLSGWGTFLGSLAAGVPPVKQFDLDSLQWYAFTIATGTFQHIEGPQLSNVAAFAGNTVAVSCVLYSQQSMSLAVGFKQNVSGTITDNIATGIALQAGVVTPVCVLIPVSASATGLQFEVQVPAGVSGNVLWASSFAAWGQSGTAYAINPNVILPVTSSGIVWTANGADYPFDLKVQGEVMSAIGVANGSLPAQTFCVARGINGVGPAIASGQDVRLAVQPTFGM